MCRGVNPRFTMLRCRVCSGGSCAISEPLVGAMSPSSFITSGWLPPITSEEKISGCRSTYDTSSKRETV